jgi:hypothetical protein
MTTSQRERVVELLRCAAALKFYEEGGYGNFLRSAAIRLRAPWQIEELARLACCYVFGDGTSRSIQVAAANRVEHGGWTHPMAATFAEQEHA